MPDKQQIRQCMVLQELHPSTETPQGPRGQEEDARVNGWAQTGHSILWKECLQGLERCIVEFNSAVNCCIATVVNKTYIFKQYRIIQKFPPKRLELYTVFPRISAGSE